MKKLLLIALTLVFGWTLAYAGSADKDAKVTTTFLVMMNNKNAQREISKALKEEKGIKKVEFDRESQTVTVTFKADENTVSGLLKMFRRIGYTATAMEVGCFGDPNGCVNAMKPDNIMP